MVLDHRSAVPLIAAADGHTGQLGILVTSISEGLRTWGASDHTGSGRRIWTYGPEMVSDMTYLGRPSNHSMVLAMSGSNPRVELVEAVEGPSTDRDWILNRGYGLHDLGFFIDEVAGIVVPMEDDGFAMVQSGRNTGADGTGAYAYFDTVSLMGFDIEAMEVPRLRHPPHRVWPVDTRP